MSLDHNATIPLHESRPTKVRELNSSSWRRFPGRVRHALTTWWYERMLGIHTRGSIDGRTLGFHDHYFGYQPIAYRSFLKAMQHLPFDARNATFIDYGCGKGRAVILAARLHFAHVIGIEYSHDLVTAAQANIRSAARHVRATEVSVIHTDACDYIPPLGPLVCFFFNPFDDVILHTVLENLAERQREVNSPLAVVYSLPRARRDLMQDYKWLQVHADLTRYACDWEQLKVYASCALVIQSDHRCSP